MQKQKETPLQVEMERVTKRSQMERMLAYDAARVKLMENGEETKR